MKQSQRRRINQELGSIVNISQAICAEMRKLPHEKGLLAASLAEGDARGYEGVEPVITHTKTGFVAVYPHSDGHRYRIDIVREL